MFGRTLILVVLFGCASAQYEAHDDHDAGIADAAAHGDAPRSADATTSATCANPFSGVLATYSFASATGTQPQTDAASSATGVVAGPVTRSVGLTAVSGATSINSSNWPLTTQLDTTKYYTLKLTPPAGCKLALTSAAIDAKASSTGPTMGALATSSDSYATTTALSTSAPSTPALAVSDATGAVEIRIYGYAATAAGGTLRLQNTVTVSGSVQ